MESLLFVKEEEDYQINFEGVWNYHELKEESREFKSAEEGKLEDNEEEEVKPPLLILVQPNGGDDDNDKCKERNICEVDGGISNVGNFSTEQEKGFGPERCWRLLITPMEPVKECHVSQKAQRCLGRPRGLVPPKSTAQRMREYRKRLKENQKKSVLCNNIVQDCTISNDRNLNTEQEKILHIERCPRMDVTSMKRLKDCSDNQRDQPTWGRPRGLLPPKSTAQRMREYRQRLKEKRNASVCCSNIAQDGGISKDRDLNSEQEKVFRIERCSRLGDTLIKRLKDCSDNQVQVPKISRPRGLGPPKSTAQRMREYRQRLKEKRNESYIYNNVTQKLNEEGRELECAEEGKLEEDEEVSCTLLKLCFKRKFKNKTSHSSKNNF